MIAKLKLPTEDSIAKQAIELRQVKQAILLSLEIMLTGFKEGLQAAA